MVLCDKEIRALCKGTSPLISNFSENSLQSESYDLSVGDSIAVVKSRTVGIDLKSNMNYERIYQKVKLSDNGYQIQPHEYILVSVCEKLNLPDNITAHIRPRTRFTRIGLLVSGQHINSSYSGYLWIGLFNASSFPIIIYKGISIAQFVFEELKSTPTESKLYRHNGSFQDEQEGDLQGSIITEAQQREIGKYVKQLFNKVR